MMTNTAAMSNGPRSASRSSRKYPSRNTECVDPIEAFRSSLSVGSSERGSHIANSLLETEGGDPLSLGPIEVFRSCLSVDCSSQGSHAAKSHFGAENDPLSIDNAVSEKELGERKNQGSPRLSAKDRKQALEILLGDGESERNNQVGREKTPQKTKIRGSSKDSKPNVNSNVRELSNLNLGECRTKSSTISLLKIGFLVTILITVTFIVLLVVQLTSGKSSTQNNSYSTTGAAPKNYRPPWSRRFCPSYPTPPPLPGKKGAAFTLRPHGLPGSWIENLPKIEALNPYWNHAWGMKRIDAQPSNIEFVPMVWGPRTDAALKEKVETYLAPLVESGQVKRLLGFNEPDQEQQANMTVTRALEYWPHLETIGLPLVSPSCAKPRGEWMENFMTAAIIDCKRVDWVGVHWYGGVSFKAFQRSITAMYEKYGRPLLITEFAPADWKATTIMENRHTSAEILAFMKQALPWLEEQEWIAGYAWFSFKKNHARGGNAALFDERGELTACGHYYASVTTDNPKGDQSISIVADLFS